MPIDDLLSPSVVDRLSTALAGARRCHEKLAATATKTFSPAEHAQFARFGLDPAKLQFLRMLADYRKGMNLEDSLIAQAFSGKLAPAAAGDTAKEELAAYA